MKGIYQYKDLETEDIVYVGKDSHIDKNKRYKDHLQPSNYDGQPFNRVLQNNPERYEYSIIWATEDCTKLKLNKMEILFGKIYNPKFNYDKFGKGGCNRHSEETKQKISEAHTGVPLSDEHKQKISDGNTGKTRSDEFKMEMSKWQNTSGYFRVSKVNSKRHKQGFVFKYSYYENSKRKFIQSASLEKLEQKVKAQGLLWTKLDEGE